MKFKKIMLITFVLLAVLTIGAVSANEGDFNETLAGENVEEVSLDASVDEEIISESDDDVVAGSDDEIISESDDDVVAGSDEEIISESDDDVVGLDEQMMSEGSDESLASSDNEVISNWTTGDSNSTEIIYGVSVSDIFEGEAALIEYRGPDGIVTVIVNGMSYQLQVVYHVAQLLIPNLSVGTYEVNAGGYVTTFSVWPRAEDAGGEIIIFIDENQNYPTTGEDVDDGFVAISLPNDMDGIVLITSGENVFFNRTFMEGFAENKKGPEDDREDYTRYVISPQDVFFFSGLNDEDEIEIAVYDFEDNKLESKTYMIFFEDDSFRFEAVGGENDEDDGDDEYPINFYVGIENKYPTSGEGYEDFINITAPNDFKGRVLIFSSKKTFFDRNLSDFESNNVHVIDYGFESFTIYSISLKDVGFFEGLDDLGRFEIAVVDCDDIQSLFKAEYYKILFNDDSTFTLFGDNMEIRIFYGNLTSGETEEGMITFATDKFIEISIPYSSSGHDMDITFDYGDGNILYSLNDFNVEDVSDEEFSGRIYYIELNDEIKNLIRQNENEIISFNFNYELNGKSISSSFKRIFKDDIFYKINSFSDLYCLFDFNMASDVLNSSDDEVVNIFCFDSNWHMAHNDLGGGIFKVYVNGTHVKSVVLFDQLVHGAPQGVSFSLDDLGISTSGNYTIKITQLPEEEDIEYDDITGELIPHYKLLIENELLSKEVVVKFEEDYEPVDSYLTVSVADINVGDVAVVNIEMNEGVNGVITIIIANNSYSVYVVNGKAGLNITDLAAGNHTITVTYAGDEYFNADEKTVTFMVNEVTVLVDPELTIRYDYVENPVIFIGTNPAFSGYVTVQVDDVNYTVNVINGSGIITLFSLSGRTHTATAVFEATEVFNASSASIMFNTKAIPFITVDPIDDVEQGNDVSFSVNTNEDATGQIRVLVGEYVYIFEIFEGQANATIPADKLSVGVNTITIRYMGDPKYTSVESNISVTVTEKTQVLVDPELSVEMDDDYVFAEDGIIEITVRSLSDIVRVDVEGMSYYVNTTGGIGNLYISSLNVGTYTLTATSDETDTYSFAEVNKTFTINKGIAILTVSVADINVGDVAVVNIIMDVAVNDDVLVSVNNINYTVSLTDGKGILNVSGLSAGFYDVEVLFGGNDNYLPVFNTTSFVVSKILPSIEITPGEAVEGSDLEVIVNLPVDATGSVVVNGQSSLLANGKATVAIENVVAGNLTIAVTYDGDEKYSTSSKSIYVTVIPKQDPNLNVSVDNIDFGQTAVVNIEIDADVTGNVTIEGNEVTITNGKGTYEISGLSAGNYTVTVSFAGDKYFNADEKTVTFMVNEVIVPVDSQLIVNVLNINVGEVAVVNIEMNEGVNGVITIIIANKSYSVYVVNGKADLNITDLAAGTFEIIASFAGNENFKPVENSTSFVVSKLQPTIEIIPGEAIEGSDLEVTVTLPTDATGEVVVNDVIHGLLRDGTFTYNIGSVSAGNLTIQVIYSGDEKYLSTSNSINVAVIPKQDPDLTVSVENINVGEVAVVNIEINAGVTGKVIVNGKEVEIVNGKATYNITNLAVGNHTITVTYAGDKYFNADEKTATFAVLLSKIVTKDTFNSYFDENGVYIADLDEIIFAGEFTGINKITIGKAIKITGQDVVFVNTLFNIIGNDVSVSGLTIKNNLTDYAVSISGSNVSLIGNNFNVVNGILVSDSSNFTIDSNTIVSTAGVDINGIYINRTGRGVVKNNNLNLISQKTAYAINTNPTGPLRVSYINNIIYAESYFAVGIYDDAEEIRDNKITLSGNYAIGIAVLSENTTVDNNGITLTTTNTGEEEIDEPLGVETAGIKVANTATITNNNVDSTGKSMSIVGGSSTISDNNLIGQVIVESDGNEISNNVITTTEESAIDASSSTGNTIKSNEAYSSSGNGNDAVKAAEGNTVSDNFEKFDPALNISVADITEGNDAVIVITTNATFSGDVLVQIGEANYTVSVTNGAGNRPVSGLGANTYTAVAIFHETVVFTASTKNATFTVAAKPAPAPTIIKATAVTTTYATSKNVVVTLTDANGNVLAGKTVTVVLNGAAKTLTTNNKGQASLAIGTALAPNVYDVTFTFAGDSAYAKSTGSVKVTVKKATPKLTAKKKTFKVKKAKKYTVTLKTDKGKALNKVKVTITVKAKGKKIKITKKTNSKGKVTFNLKKLTKKGKFTATVKFAGDKRYKAVTKKVKITVKK